MKVLIAADKFKGSLSSFESCNAISVGINLFDESIETRRCVIADGGEGTIEAIGDYLQAKKVVTIVDNPLSEKIKAYYLLKNNTAYIELAKASGLELLDKSKQNPMFTTTVGTGQLIKDAMSKGANRIYLFVGGSATNDAGMGIAHALGYKFLDSKHDELFPSGENLERVRFIDDKNLCFDTLNMKFVILTDVYNQLYGQGGAAYTFASQKGASKVEIEKLDLGLQNISDIIKNQFGVGISEIKGGGAAGGVGAGLFGLINAEIKSGVDFISEIIGLEEQIQSSDLIITGEGKLDDSSFKGKVVGKVIELSKKQNKKCAIFVGQNDMKINEADDLTNTIIETIISNAKSEEDAIENANSYLVEMAFDFMKRFRKEDKIKYL